MFFLREGDALIFLFENLASLFQICKKRGKTTFLKINSAGICSFFNLFKRTFNLASSVDRSFGYELMTPIFFFKNDTRTGKVYRL